MMMVEYGVKLYAMHQAVMHYKLNEDPEIKEFDESLAA